MNTLRKIRFANIICIVGIAIFCLPLSSTAQRFGHGGGGGFRGGGGGSRGGGGFRAAPARSAPVGRPAPANMGRSFNGGANNIGNHIFHASPGPVFHPSAGIRHNDIVFHSDRGYHHPYYYHPYHPYVWGPYWHPFGYFCAALTADAIMFSIANQQYYYDDGVYYQPSGSGYLAVVPPIGAVVSYLPNGYLTVQVGDAVYYYYAGVFYISQGNSYRVVPAPVGAVVNAIPEGATEQVINGQSYLLYNNTYYAPILQDGQDAYEVVQVN